MDKAIKTLDDNFNNLCDRDKYVRRLKALAVVKVEYGENARDTIKLWYDWESMTPGWIIRASQTFIWTNTQGR